MAWVRVVDALKSPPGTALTIKGWVRTRRDSKADGGLSFIAVSDGSCFDAIQVVARATLPNYIDEVIKLTTGCAVEVDGSLVPSQGKGQAVEIDATAVRVIGWVENPETYPVSQKRHTFEYLREVAHLRPRTNTFGSVARVRHCLAMAVHRFFDERGFSWIHTPIITASDAEGAGQMFRVSTLDLANLPRTARPPGTSPLRGESLGSPPLRGESLGTSPLRGESLGTSPLRGGSLGSPPLRGGSPGSGGAGVSPASPLAERAGHPGAGHRGAIDFSKDFFGREAHLTVSGQLNVECYCLALTNVYTFGPTFRAENSNTSRHLAEFWMIEPEIAFADLAADATLAEEFLKYLFKAVLNERADDMKFFEERIEKGVIARLEHIIDKPFLRLDYTDAIAILEQSGQTFEFPIAWGSDLQSEHERYLTEQHFKQPVILMNYPRGIKAFYMRQNDDGKTVAAMDVLAPGIGEIIGGSQREERLDRLDARIDEMGLPKEEYWWYRDLRRYGTVPHAGFGLGFERLIQFVTGMTNIRDVIPFPRAPGQADF